MFGGAFLRNSSAPAQTTTLTLSGLATHTSIDLNFLLAVIDSWDGSFVGPGPDILNVRVDGTTIFSESFRNTTATTGPPSYVPPAGVELFHAVDKGFTTASPDFYDSAYDMGLDPTFNNIPHSASTLTIDWFASNTGWMDRRSGRVMGDRKR